MCASWKSHITLVFSAPRLHVVATLASVGRFKSQHCSIVPPSIVSQLRRYISDEFSSASSHSTHCRVKVMSTTTFSHFHVSCIVTSTNHHNAFSSSSNQLACSRCVRHLNTSQSVKCIRIFLIFHVTLCDASKSSPPFMFAFCAQPGDTLLD